MANLKLFLVRKQQIIVVCLCPDVLSTHDRVGFVRKPSERVEYTTESEIEETELEQTRHNFRCNVLRASAYSDSRLVLVHRILTN